AAAFIREIVRLHGIPISIVLDRDKIFLSNYWKEIFRLQGTNMKYSTAYHPQTTDQTKVVNGSIKKYLSCFTFEKPKNWSKWLSWAEYSYNTSFHSSANTTPFKILYAQDPPPLAHYGSQPTPIFEVDRYLEERDRVLKELKEHLSKVQVNMKTKACGHRRNVQFEVGDKVFLNYIYIANNQWFDATMKNFYQGTMDRINIRTDWEGSLQTQISFYKTIHSIFHVSQLKKFIGSNVEKSDLPDALMD
nr:hypothetical protein [Tanacetum cinerariifolium]